MPFDNTHEHPHQRLMDLEAKLRRRDFGFRWDYRSCTKCAIAIDRARRNEANSHEIHDYYGIEIEDSYVIFAGVGARCGKRMREVTPDDVAAVIRTVLAKVCV